jgi:hypothetical protein
MNNKNQNETSWEIRGHTRKPNFVVRFIYALADWFGDFGPLFNTTRRGVGHLSSLVGHSLLLIVTLIITGLIVLTSAIHSLELLQWIGFSGWTAYPILFVVEAIFLTGSIQMDLAFKHGKYFPVRPILGFTAGLIFVLASNIVGLADNMGGLLFGIATPFLLIIAKAMLAWQYTFRSKIAVQSQNILEENLFDIQPKKDESETTKKLDLGEEKADPDPLDIEVENPDLDIQKSDVVLLKVDEEKTVPEQSENLDIEPDKKHPTTNNQGKTSTGQKPKKTKGSTKNKKPKRTPASKVDYNAIIEVAQLMIDKHPEKKKPTKYKLAKEAQTTEHHAQKALDMMEQKLEVNPIENLNSNLDNESEQKLDLEQPKLKRVK